MLKSFVVRRLAIQAKCFPNHLDEDLDGLPVHLLLSQFLHNAVERLNFAQKPIEIDKNLKRPTLWLVSLHHHDLGYRYTFLDPYVTS